MMIKSAREDMGRLLKAAQDENLENIQIAQANMRTGFDEKTPYKTAANKALIQGMNELIALVEGQEDS